jgi:hypothetical protein
MYRLLDFIAEAAINRKDVQTIATWNSSGIAALRR